MKYNPHPRWQGTLAPHQIDDLVEVLGELLDVPELRCIEPDEMFDATREVIAKARVIRSAVLDELAPLHAEGQCMDTEPPQA